MIQRLRQVMLERHIGDFMAAALLGIGIDTLFEIVKPLALSLTAFTYNRNVHDKLILQAPVLSGIEQIKFLISGLVLFWAAALVYSWTHETRGQTQNQRKADA